MSINAQLALPGIPAGDVIPNAKTFDAWEDSGYYFRIAGSDADILNETSVELPASAGSPDEIAQIMGYPDFVKRHLKKLQREARRFERTH